MDGKQAINYLRSCGMSDGQIVTVVDAFTKELSIIKKILDDSEMDFRMHVPTNNEELIYMPLNYILDDYTDMFRMLAEIKEIIDRMAQEEDENENIDKLRQEGEHNEL